MSSFLKITSAVIDCSSQIHLFISGTTSCLLRLFSSRERGGRRGDELHPSELSRPVGA